MERPTDIDEDRVQAARETHATNLTAKENEADPLDRRDREVVAYYEKNGEWTESPLKRDDVVKVQGVPMLVLGPSTGRQEFLSYRMHPTYGEIITAYKLEDIEDRLPADENEEPMPVTEGPPPDLGPLRQEAFAKVDAKSQELIRAGFQYKDVVFSASLEAQARYNGMLAFSDVLSYPLGINSLDDTVNLPLADADDVRAFCLTALGHIKNVVDTGSVQKQSIREMTEAAQLREYRDPR